MSEQIIDSSQRIEVPEELEAGVLCDCRNYQLLPGDEKSFLVTLRAIKAGETFENFDKCPVIAPPFAASFALPANQGGQITDFGAVSDRQSWL